MIEKDFLLYSFLLGLFITFLYDFFIIFRQVFPHKGFWISVEDFVFWSYTCMSVFLLMHRQGEGNLRWFAVLGAMTGMILYKKIISPFFVKIGTRLLFWITFPIKKIGLLLRSVFKRFFLFLGKKYKNARTIAGKKRKSAAFLMKKRLTFLLRLLKMTI